MGILVTLIALSVVIFIHELGHFLLAKRAGVGVLEFSVFMGPKIYSKKIGETDYVIRLLPIGGFVKLAGIDDAESDPCPPEMNFFNKSIMARFWTLAAGSLFNIVLGFLLFFLIFTTVGVPKISSTIDLVFPESPAAVAGLKSGDRIVNLNGRPVQDVKLDFMDVVGASDGKAVAIQLERSGQMVDVRITPATFRDSAKPVIGVQLGTEIQRMNPISGTYHAILETGNSVALVFKSLGMLVSGSAKIKDMAGPIGILQMGSFGLQRGLVSFINLFALISISLGVINLFPFPVLDGGHILFLTIEAIRKKPLSRQWESWINNAGAAVLIALMVLVVINDVVHWQDRLNLMKQFNP